jgi:hypothetical protein
MVRAMPAMVVIVLTPAAVAAPVVIIVVPTTAVIIPVIVVVIITPAAIIATVVVAAVIIAAAGMGQRCIEPQQAGPVLDGQAQRGGREHRDEAGAAQQASDAVIADLHR